MISFKQGLKDLLHNILNPKSILNWLSLLYFIGIYFAYKDIGSLGIKKYVAIVLAQLLTWLILTNSEETYILLLSNYRKYKKFEGDQKELYCSFCKTLLTEYTVIQSIILGVMYSIPTIVIFYVSLMFALTHSVTNWSIILIPVTFVEALWILCMNVNWGVMSKEFK